MNDLISRQAALDALYHVDEYNGRSVEAIRNLPSAQPEQQHRRVFQEIVVEYLSYNTYPEYEGKPYFSIKYTENGQEFIGYGTYKPEVLSEYLKEYFMPSAQPERTEERTETHTCDLISRQAAINAIENTEIELLSSEWDEITDSIMNIPSVSSDGDLVKVIRCKDCKFWTKTDLKHTDGTDVYDCPYWPDDWGWASEEGYCSGAERKPYQPKEDA